MVLVLPNLVNGDIEIGIAAGIDKVNDNNRYIQFPQNGKTQDENIAFAVKRLKLEASWSEKSKELYVKAALFAIQSQLIGDDCNVVTDSKEVETLSDEQVNKICAGNMGASTVITIMFATKVTWWMMNHHVGQDENKCMGYVGKVLHSWGLDNEAGIRDVVWSIGHWISTGWALVELGIMRTWNKYNARLDIEVSEDMRMRLVSTPAGTAKLITYMRMAERLSVSAYSLVCTIESSIQSMQSAIDSVVADPVSYHIGAMYLTGKRRIDCACWTENDMMTLSSFVNVTMPKGTLSRSGVILPATETAASEVSARFTGLKLLLATVLDNKVLKKILQKRGVGTTCFGASTGFTSVVEIEAAIRLVAEEEAAEEAKAKFVQGNPMHGDKHK